MVKGKLKSVPRDPGKMEQDRNLVEIAKLICILLFYLSISSSSFVTADKGQCSSRMQRKTEHELSNPIPIIKEENIGADALISLEEQWKAANKQPETGLEFIDDNYRPEIDEEFYMKVISSENLENNSILDVVRMFIRDLKGVPREGMPGSYIGGGEDQGSNKLAWSFFPYRLKTLAKIEIDIYNILKRFYSENGNKEILPIAESYFKDIEESSLMAISLLKKSKIKAIGVKEDPYLYIGSHPLLIYRMIRRFAEDLQPILFELQSESGLLVSIYEANPELEIFPNGDDLKDALDAIVRIQKGVNIKTEELSKGIFENIDTNLHLNSLHLLEIAAYHLSLDKPNWDLALQWVYQAFESVSTSLNAHNFPVIRQFFLKVLEYSVNAHNKNYPEKIQDLWNPGVFTSAIEGGTLNPASYVRVFDSNKKNAVKLMKNDTWNWAMPLNFVTVCSGINLKPVQDQRLLKCWNFKGRHPYWYINPLKMEMLNQDPTVIQIYGFIGHELAEKAKTAAVNALKRSTVIDKSHATKTLVEPTRTSSQTWIYDNRDEGKFLQRLTKRLELLMGLEISSPKASDAYQVAAYGPSHHYAPHIDSFEDPRRTQPKGNRIVTIMGYLNDVNIGGRTGFPVLGAFTEPIKGSIVIWENLEKDVISRDGRTYHGGCPVSIGVKWIINKWIYSRENMFKYLCKK